MGRVSLWEGNPGLEFAQFGATFTFAFVSAETLSTVGGFALESKDHAPRAQGLRKALNLGVGVDAFSESWGRRRAMVGILFGGHPSVWVVPEEGE